MTQSSPGGDAERALLSVGAARSLILDTLSPIEGWECVAVRAALDRVLARDVIAPCNVPAYDNSAMDGYAVRAADLASDAETALALVGTAFAGHPFAHTVGAGEAVRIMTGAPVPEGADTIVMQELTRREGEQVRVPAGLKKGQNLRRAGEDLAAGSIALAAGRVAARPSWA